MPLDPIDVGSAHDDPASDTIRAACTKVNTMGGELAASAGVNPNPIDVGSQDDDPSADHMLDAFTKVNSLTTSLYGAMGGTGRVDIDLVAPDSIRTGFDKINTMFTELYSLAPAVLYGPRAIERPISANVVDVTVGSSSGTIQSLINAGTSDSIFWFPEGTYGITGPLVPKSGQTFLGQLGAVFDASGWSTTDVTMGVFRANNANVDNVTIGNLKIQQFPMYGVYVTAGYTDIFTSNRTPVAGASDGWIIEYCEFVSLSRSLSRGIHLGNTSVLRHCYIHDIGGTAYAAYQTWDPVVEDNKFVNIGDHGGGSARSGKMSSTVRCIFRRNIIENSAVDGIWYDGENIDGLIEYNDIKNSGRHAIFYEVNGGNVTPDPGYAIIRYNKTMNDGFGPEGGASLFLSACWNVDAYENEFRGGFRGTMMYIDTERVTNTGVEGNRDLKNNYIHHNLITTPSGTHPLGLGAAFTTNLLAVASAGEDLTALYDEDNGDGKNNKWDFNIYRTPSLTTGGYWKWASVSHSWAQWQARPQDAGGSASVGAV